MEHSSREHSLRNEMQDALGQVQRGQTLPGAEAKLNEFLSRIDVYERTSETKEGQDGIDRVAQLRRLHSQLKRAVADDCIQTQLDTKLRELKLRTGSPSLNFPWIFDSEKREIRNCGDEILVVFPKFIDEAEMMAIGRRLIEKSRS
jgi:hypothetical protein